MLNPFKSVHNFIKKHSFVKVIALVLAVVLLCFGVSHITAWRIERSQRFQNLLEREQALEELQLLHEEAMQTLQDEIAELQASLQTATGTQEELLTQIAKLEEELETLRNRPPILPPAANSTTGGRVYLSFDDGPSANTPKILEILARYGVRATFFVINTPDFHYVRQIVDGGHVVALHSYSHNFSEIYANEEAFWADIERLNTKIYAYTGQRSNLLRFAGGSSNQVSIRYNRGIMTRLVAQVPERGKVFFDWNIDSNDANSRYGNPTPPGVIFESVRNQSARLTNAHIVMHDGRRQTTTVEALPAIIEHFLSRDFTFHVKTADTPPIHQRVAN